MDNGEMRLLGLLDDTDAPSEEELDALREELLGSVTTDVPTWGMAVGGKRVVYSPDMRGDVHPSLLNPISIDLKMGFAERIRRFLRSIFN
ncbi:hypothetical protein JW752_01675 [Candidatus Peregrinibacteria bacterium]|nr:hypothetical protein [Candidatus Peregrinibacteria bacterium]